MPIEMLEPATYNPRRIGDDEFAALKVSLRKFGMVQEVVANRRPDGTLRVVGGHQRLKAAIALGWKSVPVVEVVLDDDHEKALNVALNARTMQGSFTADLAELLDGLQIDEDLFTGLGFDELEAETAAAMDSILEAGGGGEASTKREALSDRYSHGVASPIYTPKGDCPPVESLIDTTRTDKLLAEIDANRDLPDDVRRFLRAAAHRHDSFMFRRIAEYYCHAPKEVQLLMERSALVIIDFKQAIELGFVRLTGGLAKLAEESGEFHLQPDQAEPTK